MASLPFTLAALATSAVPGLTAVAVRQHHSAGGDYASAVLTTADDEIIISVPRTPLSETKQSAQLLGLAALTDGARSELPFAVPRVLGMTRAGETRAVAATFLAGEHFDVHDLTADALLIDSITTAITAIHALPRSVAHNGGLPERTSRDLRLVATRLVDRAQATRFLPETVYQRWNEVLEAAEVWDFEPRMVHGTLGDDALLISDDRVIGVLGWSALGVGDPASDLAWVFAAGNDVFEAVVSRYVKLTGSGETWGLRSRATLYHELEIATWLLHGVESHSEEIINDAVSMLDRLVDRMSILSAPVQNRQQLEESEAIALLEETPQLSGGLSAAEADEALDEDRMFGFDTDFIDPLPDESSAAATSDEQVTAPIEDLER